MSNEKQLNNNVYGALTKEQLDTELQMGMDDVVAGRLVSADEVEREIMTLTKYKKERLKDPEFAKEYEKAQLEINDLKKSLDE